MVTEIYKLARPKLQGVVCEILNGFPIVNGEPVVNRMVADVLGKLPQFKGEIVVGKPIDVDCYAITRSMVDANDVVCPFVFWVYDMRTTGLYDLKHRLDILEPMVYASNPAVQYVDHVLIGSLNALEEYKQKVIVENFFPGVMLREPFGTYNTEDEEIAPAQALN